MKNKDKALRLPAEKPRLPRGERRAARKYEKEKGADGSVPRGSFPIMKNGYGKSI
jgi:hypothetical protein